MSQTFCFMSLKQADLIPQKRTTVLLLLVLTLAEMVVLFLSFIVRYTVWYNLTAVINAIKKSVFHGLPMLAGLPTNMLWWFATRPKTPTYILSTLNQAKGIRHWCC